MTSISRIPANGRLRFGQERRVFSVTGGNGVTVKGMGARVPNRLLPIRAADIPILFQGDGRQIQLNDWGNQVVLARGKEDGPKGETARRYLQGATSVSVQRNHRGVQEDLRLGKKYRQKETGVKLGLGIDFDPPEEEFQSLFPIRLADLELLSEGRVDPSSFFSLISSARNGEAGPTASLRALPIAYRFGNRLPLGSRVANTIQLGLDKGWYTVAWELQRTRTRRFSRRLFGLSDPTNLNGLPIKHAIFTLSAGRLDDTVSLELADGSRFNFGKSNPSDPDRLPFSLIEPFTQLII